MYKNNLDLKEISFEFREQEYYEDNKSNSIDYNQNFNPYEDRYVYQEKLNLTLKISYELIEEIDSSDELIHINVSADIKKDIYIERKRYYRIFGKAVDFKGTPYKDVLIRLFKYNFIYANAEKNEIDKCFTNEFGEFNFVVKISRSCDWNNYKAEIDDYYKSF